MFNTYYDEQCLGHWDKAPPTPHKTSWSLQPCRGPQGWGRLRTPVPQYVLSRFTGCGINCKLRPCTHSLGWAAGHHNGVAGSASSLGRCWASWVGASGCLQGRKRAYAPNSISAPFTGGWGSGLFVSHSRAAGLYGLSLGFKLKPGRGLKDP